MSEKTTIHTDGGHEAQVNTEDLKLCRDEILSALENGASYDDISDIVSGDLGLEMDYVMDILGI